MPLGQTAMTLMFFGKSSPDVLQVAEQEAVRQAERRARAQRLEDLLVVARPGRRRRSAAATMSDSRIDLRTSRRACRSSSVKPGLGGRLHRRRALAQADHDLDAGALERVAQVLGLGRALRAPADHADLLDALEGLGQQREQVAAAATMVSSRSAILTTRVSNTFEVKLIDGILRVARIAGLRRLPGATRC